MSTPALSAVLQEFEEAHQSRSVGDTERQARPWPTLAPAALHGLAGDFVRQVEPHTEADPVALLVQMLAFYGVAINRTAHFVVEADRHFGNLFIVLAGTTSKGRKGTSEGRVRELFRMADEGLGERIVHGLSSGEGLIWAVRDPIFKLERNKTTGETSDVMIDAGIEDKRLLVVESELAQALRVLRREGNTLSPIIRNAWDRGDLRSLTKNSPAIATGAHIGIVGHITMTELNRNLGETDAANGFANRFAYFLVRRSKCLPEGGGRVDLDGITGRLRGALEFARCAGEIRRDDTARAAWAKVYPDLSEGRPGLLGAVTARAEAQAMRFALLYALLDRSHVIGLPHLKAGLALWEYAEQSARYIFGDALGDPVADEIFAALKDAGSRGMTRNALREHFGRNRRSAEIGRALEQLRDLQLVHRQIDKPIGKGRPTEVWTAERQGADQ